MLSRIKVVQFPKILPIKNFVTRPLAYKSHQQEITSVEDPIVVTDDGSVFVCWHPEKEFPYECTKPMPGVPVKQESVLKTTREDALKVFGKKPHDNDIRAELAKLTHTTKHRWFPRNWDRRKQYKRIKPDREYL